MKQLVVFSVMCLSTLFAKAQVMTSETVNDVYASVIAEDKARFAYNGEFDDNGRMTGMTVYQKDSYRDGQECLNPVCQYEYDYTTDGLLKSRVKYVWHRDQWQCCGRHDYTLEGNIYTAAYSRWDKKSADFAAATEKIVYTLLPDNSTCHISFYQSKHHHDTLQLAWQIPVTTATDVTDYLLTQK